MVPFWPARALEQVGDWILLVALLVTAWESRLDLTFVGLILIARLTPRIIVAAFVSRSPAMGPSMLAAIAASRAVVAGLLVVLTVAEPAGLAAAAATLGLLSAATAGGRTAWLPQVVPASRLSLVGGLDAVVDRFALCLGPLLATALFMLGGSGLAFAGGATALLLSAAFYVLMTVQAGGHRPQPQFAVQVPSGDAPRPSRAIVLLAAAFSAGAIAGSVTLALLPILDLAFGGSSGALGVGLAAIGLGALLGPLPVGRLMLRVPVSMLVLASIGVSATGVLAIAYFSATFLLVPVLLLMGLVGVTHDTVRAIAARRLASDERFGEFMRALLVAGGAGQVAGAASVAVGSAWWGTAGVLAIVAVVAVVIAAAAHLVGADPFSRTPRQAATVP
ncbi:MAG: hypothetical protein M3432_06070 [Chloroflexota bacterium]|nr:hypothetical protein [Chloroflexota bacterium]